MILVFLVFYRKKGLVTVTERASTNCTRCAADISTAPTLPPLCDRAASASSRLGGNYSFRRRSARRTGRSGRYHQGSSRTYSSSIVPVVHINPAGTSNDIAGVSDLVGVHEI